MQDIPTLSIMLATTGLLIGILYHINTLRHAKQTRQAQLYMRFITLGMDKDLLKDLLEVNNWEWKDEKELQQKYNTPDHFAKFFAVNQYYMGMGTLVKKNLIQSDMVPTGIALLVRSFWKKYKPIAARLTDDPHAFDMIEYLYHEIKDLK